MAHGQQLGFAGLAIAQALAMATKPEFDQIGETPAVGWLPLPLQPWLTLVRVQHKALERQRLALGGKLLAHAWCVGVRLARPPLWIDLGKPLARCLLSYCHHPSTKIL
ncbi:hypothetical protein D3C85_1624570 [compost metagenome]